MPKLYEKLSVISEALGESFFKDKVDPIILDNLKLGAEIRPYQNETFGRFIYYLSEYQARPKGVPSQLLFHMATGSGKTLIMAGIIIYLYKKGYRNFLFFVNSTNIIEKTRDNFLNPSSPKYLFSDVVSISGKQIRISFDLLMRVLRIQRCFCQFLNNLHKDDFCRERQLRISFDLLMRVLRIQRCFCQFLKE